MDRETMTITNALEVLRVPGARRLLLCLLVVGSSLACTPQAKLVGPTVPSGYFFAVRVSDSNIAQDVATELTVRVQDAQGQPVDGVPVEFQVEPGGGASVSPQRVITNGGTARAIFKGQSLGRALVRVRVENTTQDAAIMVVDLDPD